MVYLIMRHAGSYVGVFIEYLRQEYSVQVTFREQWNDERLRYVDSTKGNIGRTNYVPHLINNIYQNQLVLLGRQGLQLQGWWVVGGIPTTTRTVSCFVFFLFLKTCSRGDQTRSLLYEICINQKLEDCCLGKLNYLTLTDPSKVWMPDTFFRNEKEAKKHEIIVPNVYVRIYPNGDILYSIR